MTGPDPATTRRGFLALAGGAALAGCPLYGGGNGDGDPVTVEAATLADIASGSIPIVTEPLPVAVADSHVRESRAAAESTLERVPLPLSTEDVPTTETRRHLTREADEARAFLARAAEAGAVRERLSALRRAREHAADVAGAWAFVADEIGRPDVHERGRTLEAETQRFRESRSYPGSDPVRALLAHGTVESWAERAVAEATPGWNGDRLPPTGAPTPDDADATELPTARDVGDRAGAIEYGAAFLADARHVDARYRAALSTDDSIRPTLAAARESLTATVRSRRADVPAVDVREPDALVGTDVEAAPETRPALAALRELHGNVYRVPSLEPGANVASDVLTRYATLENAAAFERLREDVAASEREPVEGAAAVRERRDTAASAVESVLDESADPRLARERLAYLSARLRFLDEDLRAYEGAVEVGRLRSAVAAYVEITARARAIPTASATVLDALGVDGTR